eukprot:XP_025001557.1 collagen alpha-1(I) chain-like [Gallus gallus]
MGPHCATPAGSGTGSTAAAVAAVGASPGGAAPPPRRGAPNAGLRTPPGEGAFRWTPPRAPGARGTAARTASGTVTASHDHQCHHYCPHPGCPRRRSAHSPAVEHCRDPMAAPRTAARLLPPLLLALAAPSAAFWVRSWPRVAVVPFGGSVPINCSRGFCPGPAAPPELLWESESAAGPGGRRWRTFILSNVSQWQPRPALCRAECGDSAANASTAVIVYKQPAWVQLDAVPAVPVGAAVTLRCRVAECAPVANLTVTLRRGAETLSTHSFPAAPGSAAVTVSHALTAGPGDHGQTVRCHAELSLRPHGPLFARAAAPIRLSVPPGPPPSAVPSAPGSGQHNDVQLPRVGRLPGGGDPFGDGVGWGPFGDGADGDGGGGDGRGSDLPALRGAPAAQLHRRGGRRGTDGAGRDPRLPTPSAHPGAEPGPGGPPAVGLVPLGALRPPLGAAAAARCRGGAPGRGSPTGAGAARGAPAGGRRAPVGVQCPPGRGGHRGDQRG